MTALRKLDMLVIKVIELLLHHIFIEDWLQLGCTVTLDTVMFDLGTAGSRGLCRWYGTLGIPVITL